MRLWLRDETKPMEERTALTPEGCIKLREAGIPITVEYSESRAFPDQAYQDAGCRMVESGEWRNAPPDVFVLGLKELQTADFSLNHRHIHFAHVYKEQNGWDQMLRRFGKGGGKLFDLEFLTDENGRRVAAFGYWAGYVGAAVGIQTWCQQRRSPDTPLGPRTSYSDRGALLSELRNELDALSEKPKVMVMGAKGRCGSGASEVVKELGLEATYWDQDETRAGGPFREILDHDIFVNCVLVMNPIPPFVTHELLEQSNRRLSVISDVTNDPTGPCNTLPVYQSTTNLKEPTLRLKSNPALDLVAIDHLPSLLPKESSEDFCEQLLPHLIDLKEGSGVWERAENIFQEKLRAAEEQRV